jgi:hypothetical protein
MAGMTLFELLTGELPIDVESAMDWGVKLSWHPACHAARLLMARSRDTACSSPHADFAAGTDIPASGCHLSALT